MDAQPPGTVRAALPPPHATASSTTPGAPTSDAPVPTATDGWSPATLTAVRSRHEGGFFGSALKFASGGVVERPGQRLSTAQVDELAPFYATQFGLDEGFVRAELAKVNVYVGGPSSGGEAVTIGHHVFMPDEQSFEKIMTRPGRRWLAHELAHTMQFLAYEGGSPHRFLADYVKSFVVGRDPQLPGAGDGPLVWGALFTGLRSAGTSEQELGSGASSLHDRFASTVLPAATVSVPVALIAGGGLAAVRATTRMPLLGTGSSTLLGASAIAAPALAGAAIGTFGDTFGDRGSAALGAGAGGALAAGALWRSRAFTSGLGAAMDGGALGNTGKHLGRLGTIGLAAGAVVGAAAIGAASGSASANTTTGWSRSAGILRDLRSSHDHGEQLGIRAAVHDSHWAEIDAEALARQFIRGAWDKPASGSGPVAGRIPTMPDPNASRLHADWGDRIDWGVEMPLLVGVPAAVAAGGSVLAARVGTTLLRSSFRDGLTPGQAVSKAFEVLGSDRRGVRNSLGVGSALTVWPLMAGGIAGPLAYQATGSETLAKVGGAGAGALVGGALLTFSLKGRGAGLIATSGRVAAGMVVAGAAGLLSGSVATGAMRPQPRTYDLG